MNGNGNSGIVSKIFQWLTSARYSDTTLKEWLAGLALILILSFLWSTVIKQVISETGGAIEKGTEAITEVLT